MPDHRHDNQSRWFEPGGHGWYRWHRHVKKKNQMCHGKNTMIKGWLGHPSHFGNPDMRWIFIYIMIYIYLNYNIYIYLLYIYIYIYVYTLYTLIKQIHSGLMTNPFYENKNNVLTMAHMSFCGV